MISIEKKDQLPAQLAGPWKAELTEVVRKVLGSKAAEVTVWHIDEVASEYVAGAPMGAATGGVYRISGSALDRVRGEAEIAWAVVLKIVSFGTPGSQAEFRDESHPLYWEREALAYRSGLLDNLPGGVRAPRCYAVVERDSNTIWLWLEDVKDECAQGWSPEQYARAAECLGRFNGAYLVDHQMPAYSWLIRTGSPRGLLDHSTEIRDALADPRTWRHPLVRSAFPVPVVDRVLRLWDEREMLLRPLDRVPHTFGHLDAWRGNMFASSPEDAGKPNGLILIDWAYPGRGAAGTDAGDLFAGSFSLAENGDIEPRQLDQAIFGGYLAGLHAAGWRAKGHERAVRFAFAASCALKYGCFLVWLCDVPDEQRRAIWEHQSNRSFFDYAHRQASLLYYLLDLADEARGLLT
jgi:hypothetical protein